MATTGPAGQPTALSLADIAVLANVQRPVVSMWRTRTRVRGRTIQFPTVANVVGGVELFAVDDVVAYLADTGRGKNPDTAVDAPTISAPQTADRDAAVVLLCLGALTGTDLGSMHAADLSSLAAHVDPDDRFLLREIQTHRWAPDLLDHVDELRAGSFGPQDALARLERGPLARRRGDRAGSRDLTTAVAAVAEACGTHLAAQAAGTSPHLDLAAEQFLGGSEGSVFGDLFIDGNGPAERRLRRHALLTGWSVALDVTEAPVLRIRSVVGVSTREALTQADDVVLGLRPHDAAMVIGSAATLTDALVGEDERTRAAIVRPGSVATALRLPRGWSRAAHRQSLAVWVVTGRAGANAVRVADLEGVPLELTDLSADVTAALTREGGRQYRYLRHRSLAPVLAGGALVPRGTRALRLDVSDGDALLIRVRGGVQQAAAPVARAEVFVTAAPSRLVLQTRSLGELVDVGVLRLHRGVRIDAASHDHGGTVEVWTAAGARDVRLDPFNADRLHPRALRTEAGDVVFEEKPTPRAVVDPTGGALVASPARVLRLTGRVALGPYLLADRINRAAPGTEWRTVELPSLPDDAARSLDAALAIAAERRTELLGRVSALEDAMAALVDGVAAGVLTMPEEPPTPSIPPPLSDVSASVPPQNR